MNIDNLSDDELWEKLGPKPKRQIGFYSAAVLPTDILRIADVVISYDLKSDSESFSTLVKKLKDCQKDANDKKSNDLLRPPQWPIDSQPADAGGHGIGARRVAGWVADNAGTAISTAGTAASMFSYIRSTATGPLPTTSLGITNFSVSTASNLVGAVNLVNTGCTVLENYLPKPVKTTVTAVNNIANATSPYISLTRQIIGATQGNVSVGGFGPLSVAGQIVGGSVGSALSVSAGPVGLVLGLILTSYSVSSTMDVYGTLWDLREHLYPCTCGQCDGRLKFIIERYDQINSAKAIGFGAGFIGVGLLPMMAIGIRKLYHRTQGNSSQKHQICLQMIQAARSRGVYMEGTSGAAPVNGKPYMPGYQVTTPGCPTAIATIALLMGEHGTKDGYLKTLAVMLSTDGVDNVKKKIP